MRELPLVSVMMPKMMSGRLTVRVTATMRNMAMRRSLSILIVGGRGEHNNVTSKAPFRGEMRPKNVLIYAFEGEIYVFGVEIYVFDLEIYVPTSTFMFSTWKFMCRPRNLCVDLEILYVDLEF